jgi:hypothetical protein
MIWLQRDGLDGGRASKEAMAVYRWALLERVPVRWFEPHQLFSVELPLSPSEPVIGSVECVSAALAQLGAAVPEPDYYPACLQHHLHRQVARTTAGDVRARLLAGETLFAKSHAWKRLTGCVLCPSDVDSLSALPADEPLWVSEPVEFLAEFRAYALGDRVLGVCQYGEGEDVVLTPEQRALIDAALAHLVQACPRAAYVVDWGLLADGRLALVEVGDAWAVGLYAGLAAQAYAECLLARWREMAHTV